MNNSMSLAKTWSELYEIHKATNRSALVKYLYKDRPLTDSWVYYATLALCVITTIFIFTLSAKQPSALLLAIPEIAIIYAWINVLIENDNKELCAAHKLRGHNFYHRQKHISYLLFADKLNKKNTISKSEVDLLVNWEKIRNEKYNVFSFFHTPVVLIVLTMTAGILSGYFAEQIESEKLLLRSFLSLLFFALFFLWSFSDTMQTNTKKNKEICQFLEWWKIDEIT